MSEVFWRKKKKLAYIYASFLGTIGIEPMTLRI